MRFALSKQNRAASIASIFLYFATSFTALTAQIEESWILFYIEVTGEFDRVQRLGQYGTMFECFDAWSRAEEALPKPKINFQIICIHTRREKLAGLPG